MEGNQQEINEEFIKHEVQTELDAVHPRFMAPQDAQVVREYEIKHHYYCDSCKLFFAPTYQGLKNHFCPGRIRHKPYASCFYCQGEVYEYKLNNERQLYHNCRDNKKDENQ